MSDTSSSTKPRRLDPPTTSDPLGEPTLNRRVWALYLYLGYDRARFARAMDISYSIACRWDNGTVQMSAASLSRACKVLNVSADALLFGGREARDAPVDHVMIRHALDQVDASAAARAAFGAHVASPVGRYQHVTVHYVHRWVQVFDAERQTGTRLDRAAELAFAEAINARAAVAAAVATAGADVPARPRKARKRPARLPSTLARAH